MLVPLLFPLTKAGADAAVSIVAILYLAELVFYERERLQGRSFLLFSAFTGYIVLSALIISPFPGKTALSALFYGRFFLFFGALSCWIGPVAACRRLVFGGVGLSLLIVTIDGLYQHVFDVSLSGRLRFERRLTSFFRRPLLGFFVATLIWPVALFYLRECSAFRAKLFGAVALSVVIVFLTGDRAISALMALSLLWIAGAGAYYYPRYRLHIVLTLVLTSILGFLYARTQHLLIGRLRVLFQELGEFTVTSYGQLFKSAWIMWCDHPLWGVGYKGFAGSNSLLYDQGMVTYLGIHSHNYYLAFMAELGLVGFAFWMVFGVMLTRYVLSGDFLAKALGGATLIIIFWPLTTTMDFFSNGTAIVTWLALGLLYSEAITQSKLAD
jgi:O-antigen ligase